MASDTWRTRGLLADADKHVLLLDLDIQPTLSSYFDLTYEAPRRRL